MEHPKDILQILFPIDQGEKEGKEKESQMNIDECVWLAQPRQADTNSTNQLTV
jgi:hypothetical protein